MSALSKRSFVVEDRLPVYLSGDVVRTMDERVAKAREKLRSCDACPRGCLADRAVNGGAFCGVGVAAPVVSATAHQGEEDCLRGTGGSGTIFFGRCNLQCVFCQNWDISQRDVGRKVEPVELAEMMLQLQSQGCHNVNLVSPSHVVPHVVEAVALAVKGGLNIPIVYNSGGYDSLVALKLLDGLIDVYMPDFKFWMADTAARLCGAADYPECARAAILEMHRQVGDLCVDRDGLAVRGMLVRHLVLPGLGSETQEILRWIARELSPDTHVNVMGQYHADYLVGDMSESLRGEGGDGYADINRRPTRSELEEAYAAARATGLWRLDGHSQY